MYQRVSLLVISALLVNGCTSNDSDRIQELEKKIQDLEAKNSPNPKIESEKVRESETFQLKVIVKQPSTNYFYETEEEARAQGCYGTGGVSEGTSLKVLNATGTVVGLSKLKLRIYDLQPPDEYSYQWITWCEGYTTVTVPKTTIYQVRVGLRNAGEYTFAELQADKWVLNLQA